MLPNDIAVAVLVGCAFGLVYMALRHYTDWAQYNYGLWETADLLRLWRASRAVKAKWSAVWALEGGCWMSVAYVVTRFVPH